MTSSKKGFFTRAHAGALLLAVAAGTSYAAESSSIRDQAYAASERGAAVLAHELAQKQPKQFSELEYAWLWHESLAQRLRWSQSEMNQLTGPERAATLDATLAESERFLSSLPQEPNFDGLRRTAMGDRIFGLTLRGRMKDAITLFESLQASGGTIPPYVWVATGTAYEYEERLDEAIACFETALAQAKPGDIVSVNVREALVYAYLDRGRYEDADAQLDLIDREAPPYIESAPVAELPNPDFLRARQLRAQYLLYSGNTEAGTTMIDALKHDAPFSSGLRNTAADARMGDGKTEQARSSFRASLLERPDDTEALIGLARSSLQLRDYQTADQIVQVLGERLPERAAVRNLQRAYDVYQSPLLTVEGTGAVGDNGPTVSADNEWSLDTHLYTSPINYNWRLYFHQFTGRSLLDDGHLSRIRNGAGLEYRRDRIEASGELHQSTGTHGRTGVSASVNYYPSDGWRLAAQVDTDSNDVPWRALDVGIHATTAAVSVRHQPNQRSHLDLAYKFSDYSDSNKRQEIGLTWFNEAYSVRRHGISTWVSVSHSRNSLTDTPYFSPDHDLTAQLTAMYEWRPWRDGQYAFRQRVYGTVGTYKQADHSAHGLWEVRLEQVWDLPRGKNIIYGLGHGRRSYDGRPESRTMAYFSLNIPF